MKEESRSEDGRKERIGRKVMRIFAFAFLGVMVAALFALVFGFVAKWLWNWLMPDIFGLRQITYWQAFGLLLLARLFFGRFGHHAPSHHGHRSGKGSFHHHMDRLSHHGLWEERGQGPAEHAAEGCGKES